MRETAEVKWTADQLDSMVRQAWPQPQYACLSQVREGTGFVRNGSCDILAMGLWPSIGLELIGFEIKVSRSDWMREMQLPLKSEAFSKFCSWWYIVAPPGVVNKDELPALWGLMEPVGEKLKCRRPPTKRPDIVPPDKHLLASVIRKVTQESPSQVLLDKTRAEAFEEGKQIGIRQERNAQANYKYQDLAEMVRVFQEKSGIELNKWEGSKIGEAVRYVLEWDRITDDLKFRRDQLRKILEATEGLIK